MNESKNNDLNLNLSESNVNSIDLIGTDSEESNDKNANKNETNEVNKSYYKLHKEDWNTRKICKICGKTYTRNTRSGHMKTDKHMRARELAEKNAQIKELENKIKNLNDFLNTAKTIID